MSLRALPVAGGPSPRLPQHAHGHWDEPVQVLPPQSHSLYLSGLRSRQRRDQWWATSLCFSTGEPAGVSLRSHVALLAIPPASNVLLGGDH